MSYFRVYDDFMARKDLSLTEKIIYEKIYHFEQTGQDFYMSDKGIADALGIGERTVSRAINNLIQLKMIRSKYCVNDFFFKNYESAKKQALKKGAKIKRYLNTNGRQNVSRSEKTDAKMSFETDAKMSLETGAKMALDNNTKEAHNAASFYDESSYSPSSVDEDFWA